MSANCCQTPVSEAPGYRQLLSLQADALDFLGHAGNYAATLKVGAVQIVRQARTERRSRCAG